MPEIGRFPTETILRLLTADDAFGNYMLPQLLSSLQGPLGLGGLPFSDTDMQTARKFVMEQMKVTDDAVADLTKRLAAAKAAHEIQPYDEVIGQWSTTHGKHISIITPEVATVRPPAAARIAATA